MVERSKSRRLTPVGTPREVVAGCKEYSARLKEKALPVKLHTNVGVVAEGTVSLEADQAGVNQIVVQAKGSQLFGLVKLSRRHVFKVGELERSQSTHTAFLRRSVKILTRGNEAAKEEMLERSLSLIHEREAVDITCETKEECSRLAVWIDAKWSVAMLQKSFRGNPRIALALRGRNQTLNEKGIYELIEREQKTERIDEGEEGVDSVGYGVLPKLDEATKSKLQDDLLNGVHVTYHDLAFGGNYSRSFPRRLRYDCESKAGLIYLEASYEEDGKTIVQNIAELIQVGGGPSAHGPTAGLLRATQGKPAQREAAISLVFRDMSMDITCGTKQDAWELVLYFCEVIGFDRGQAKSRPKPQVFQLAPVEETSQSDRMARERRTPEMIEPKALGMHRTIPVSVLIARDSESRPNPLRRATSLDSTDHDPAQPPSPTFSTRYRAGIGHIGKEHPTQVSASSGFGLALSRSISNSSAGSTNDRSGLRPVHPKVRQRNWTTTRPRQHHGAGGHRSGGGGVGVPNSWVVQLEPSMAAKLSTTGPIPTPLPDARGKKGRSVTPTPRRLRPLRTSDPPAAGMEQVTRAARDLVSVAASAGDPSSGDGRGGEGSQNPPGSSRVPSHPQQRRNVHHGGRPRGEPPSSERERRHTVGRGDARPDGHSATRALASHPQPPDHHPGGRHRGEPTSHEWERRYAAGRSDARPDGQSGAAHSNHRNRFNSTPTAEGSSGAPRRYGNAPGDQAKGVPISVAGAGSTGHDRSHVEFERTPDLSRPGAGDHPRRSPRNHGMHGVERPEEKDYLKHPPQWRGTPKEVHGPSKDAMRRGAGRRSTLNDASRGGVSSPHRGNERRNTLGDSAGQPGAARTTWDLVEPGLPSAERRTAPSRDPRHADHKPVLPSREREPRNILGDVQSTAGHAGVARTKLGVPSAQRRRTPPRGSRHADQTPVIPREEGGRHGSRADDEEAEDRTRARSMPDPFSVQTSDPAKRHSSSPPRPAIPFSSPADLFSSAQDAQEAGFESPHARSGGDERPPGGARRRFGGIERIEHVEPAGKSPSVSPPGDQSRMRSSDGESRSHTARETDAAKLEDDENFTTYRLKGPSVPGGEDLASSTGQSGAATRHHQPHHQKGGGTRKAIAFIKNLASGGGGNKRDIIYKSGEGTVSPTAESGSGMHRRHQRQGGRFFSTQRGAVASPVETFSSSIESNAQGRSGGTRSPGR